MRLAETPLTAPLSTVVAEPPGKEVRLFWLGQAGFVIDGGGRRVVVDPYLSNSLADKYRGTTFPHMRMMPPPVAPDQIRHVDLVLATHAHTDHLDAGTLPRLMAANPQAKLIAPRAAASLALERASIPSDRLIGIDASERVAHRDLAVTATRAAHERLETDESGRHRFLGLSIEIAGCRIFHSGDTIPYHGQIEEVRALRADLALFPVNGRDVLRAANGVPGNMNMAEAIELASGAGIDAMIAHHFDMFEFNTVPRHEIEQAASRAPSPYVFAARTNVSYGPAVEAAEHIS